MQVIAVQYKNLIRWDVKSFLIPSWEWGERELVPLGSILNRRSEEYKGAETPTLLSIHFDGELTKRKTKDLKGRVFTAYPGDVVYSKIDVRNGAIGIVPGTYGEVAFTSEFPIYEVDTGKINSLYLQLILKTSRFNQLINSLVSGSSGRKRVNPEGLEGLKIPLPSLVEQKKIVDSWVKSEEKVAELLQNSLAQINACDDIFFSHFHIEQKEFERSKIFSARFKALVRWDAGFFAQNKDSLLSDIFVPLSNAISELQTEKIIPKKSDQYLYVGLEHIEKDTGRFSFSEVSGSSVKSQSIVLQHGNIYYAKLRPNLNKAFVFERDEKNFIATGEIYGINPKRGVDARFILYVLLSKLVRDQIASIMIGSRMPRISESAFRNLKIVLPPLATQEEIVVKVERIRAQAAEMRYEAEQIRADAKSRVEKLLLG